MPKDLGLLTTEQVAAMLGVNDSRVRQLCRAGLIEATRLPGKRGQWVMQKDDVERFMQAREVLNAGKQGKRGRPFKA